jgi:hypothetical protein
MNVLPLLIDSPRLAESNDCCPSRLENFTSRSGGNQRQLRTLGEFEKPGSL